MSKQATREHRAIRIAQEREAALRRRRRVLWWSVVLVVGLMVGGLAGYVIHEEQQPASPAAAPAGIAEDRAGVVLGSGPVTVELYSDFLCPACRAFERDARDEIDSLLAGGRIRLVYRPVAILDRMSSNEYSTRSAAAAGCAADAGKLIDFAKVLFDNQPAEGGAGHDNEALIRLAGTAGLTDAGFGQCVWSGRYLTWVGQVTELMTARNVRGTPTVVVAGTQLTAPDGARLVDAVDAATPK